jgi:hypothetical protein
MNKTKIDWLVVLPHDGLVGGMEQLLLNLVEYLIDTGNQCCVVFLKKELMGLGLFKRKMQNKILFI